MPKSISCGFRHRVRQEQRAVLHACRGLPHPRQGRRHRPETRQDETVYDPTCGSGSLLIKAAAEAPGGLSIYGQEKDNATWALAKMNMILHGYAGDADIRKGDTITNPQFTKGARLTTFDFVVMNPPFSLKSWSNGLENEYGRFEFGKPPAKNGDYAFLLHALKSLKSTGKAAVIMPHGVLFRGNSEATIRKALLQRGYIKGVIGLPPNLFYGTGIPACIVVLDKENAQARTGVFMIDASKGFMKDGAKNRLRSQDIHKIVDVFTKQAEIDAIRGWCRSARSPTRRTTSTSTFPATSTPRSLRTSRTCTPTCTAASRSVTLTLSVTTGTPFLSCAASSSSLTARAMSIWRSMSLTCSRPSLTRQTSRTLPTARDSPIIGSLRTVQAWPPSPATQIRTSLFAPSATIFLSASSRCHCSTSTTPTSNSWTIGTASCTTTLPRHAGGMVDAAKPRLAIEDKDRKLTEEPDLVIGSGKKATKYKMDLVPPALIVARYLPTSSPSRRSQRESRSRHAGG